PLPSTEEGRTSTGSGDIAQFDAIGREFLGYFIEHCGLQSHYSVLDIGCGIGRMARCLAGVLGGSGSYDVFDAVGWQIAWCQRNITPILPNFRFHHFDLANSTYNPGGTIDPESFRFPFAESSFDLVVATSVFTHMLPQALEHYLAEIARVLRKGG